MCVATILLRHSFEQAHFDLEGRLAARQPSPIGDAEDVRIHGDRGLAERHIEDHIRGLAPDPRKRFQRCTVCGNFAGIALDQ